MKSRKIHTMKCGHEGCENNLSVRSDALKTYSGLCRSHSHTKRPFESIYNGLFNDHRKLEVLLTYEEFLEFTQKTECHYCFGLINWEPYGTVNGKFRSRAYYLDRKNLSVGYSKENCVVCCTFCNTLRGNRFEYDEFLLLAPGLRQVMVKRDI